MSRFHRICSKTFPVLTGLAMAVAVVLGMRSGVLEVLAPDLASLWILVMIYGSYPLYMLLLLWPKQKSHVECWILILSGLPILVYSAYSSLLLSLVGPGPVPALVMISSGWLQLLVTAALFILLALIRLWRCRQETMAK